MNHRQYETFHAIARLGSFHAAARHLRTSQAAVSGRIRALEDSLGAPLFARVHDGVRLTAKGEALLPYATQLLDLADGVRRLGDAAAMGRVRFGATGIHAITWLPTLLGRLAEEKPGIAVDLAIDTSETLQAMLEQGRLDIAVIAAAPGNPRLTTEPIGPIPNVWVASPALALPSGDTPARLLAEHPIISDRPGSRLHDAVLAWFREDGAYPRRHHSASHWQARLHLAEAGLGVALAPYSAAMHAVRRGALVAVRTARAAPSLDYVLARAGAALSPAAQHVAEAARAMICRHPDLDTYFAAASIAER